MYKVFPVPGGYQIFWCPSEHEMQPLNHARTYPKRQAAYRRAKQLNDATRETDKLIEQEHGAIIL